MTDWERTVALRVHSTTDMHRYVVKAADRCPPEKDIGSWAEASSTEPSV